VGAHHVHLTDNDIGFFDPNARLSPPLRSQRDRDAIRAALMDGTIDAICSDHTPVDDDEKLLPFGEASPGATGLELLLSLSLKWADEQLSCNDKLTMAISRITADAARVAGLSAGGLSTGSVADVCVFDADARWLVNAAAIVSQGKHTPFLGYELPGQVRHTIVSGRLAYSR
jgi:dihydroorotase